jgi:hypothetical protein
MKKSKKLWQLAVIAGGLITGAIYVIMKIKKKEKEA